MSIARSVATALSIESIVAQLATSSPPLGYPLAALAGLVLINEEPALTVPARRDAPCPNALPP